MSSVYHVLKAATEAIMDTLYTFTICDAQLVDGTSLLTAA